MSTSTSAEYRLDAAVGDRLRTDEPLGPRTTFRVGGSARFFVEARSVEDVVAVVQIAEDCDIPVVVIGRGSNMLVSDHGFAGVALSIAQISDSIEIDSDAAVCVVGGGVELPRVARQTAAAGLTGFEWAVGVPGSIGGAVRMNAGGHGSDIADTLIDAEIIDPAAGGGVHRVDANDLGFRFRSSNLSPSAVVLRARLRLAHGDVETSKALLSRIVRWRREHQPGGQNCGSVFVNPVPGEISAGRLIDDLGLRGFRIGSASVSDKHANFIQADPAGSAQDVVAVIESVRERVAAATGIRLRSEVRLVGFDSQRSETCDDPVGVGTERTPGLAARIVDGSARC